MIYLTITIIVLHIVIIYLLRDIYKLSVSIMDLVSFVTDTMSGEGEDDADTASNIVEAMKDKSVDENLTWIGILLLTLVLSKGSNKLSYTQTHHHRDGTKYDTTIDFKVVETKEGNEVKK